MSSKSRPNTISLQEAFASIEDPRIDRTREHKLIDILMIAVCAVISGAEGFTQIEEFGRSKQEWFRSFLELPNGIPSHDTFGRLFAKIDSDAFQQSFLGWIQQCVTLIEGQIVAIDGKEPHGVHQPWAEKPCLCVVSAWASANRIVLAQQKVAQKSNEITAIPLLLELLAIKGCIVTIDAMGCQKEIAQTIIDQEAHYVLCLKGNQGKLRQDTQTLFESLLKEPEQSKVDSYVSQERAHGRMETRTYWVATELDTLRTAHEWPQLRAVGRVDRVQQFANRTEHESRYFILSWESDAHTFATAVRSHWGIENSVHWVLDVVFHEDDYQSADSNAAFNFSILRHIALNLLRSESSSSASIRTKRMKAAWSDEYRAKVLNALD